MVLVESCEMWRYFAVSMRSLSRLFSCGSQVPSNHQAARLKEKAGPRSSHCSACAACERLHLD